MNALKNELPGRYKTLGKLGEGGLAIVWRVEDLERDRVIALKWLKTGLPADDDAEAGLRLKREYYVQSGLDHPAFAPAHDLGEAGGRPYFTMAIVTGAEPRPYLREFSDPAARLRSAWRLGEQLLSALAYLHARGIVHGDLSMANLRVTKTGQVMLLDLGLSGIRPGSMEPGAMSGGTPLYISPERIRGQGVDGRADLYSAGAILFELACGRPPFAGPDAGQLLADHLRTPPPSPRTCNPAIDEAHDAFLLRLLAKRPEERFPSALAARQALLAWSTSTKHPVVPHETGGRPLIRPPYIGNAPVLSRVRDAVTRLAAGTGGAWLIRGEAGAGKSRLLEEALGFAADHGIPVLAGATREAGGEPGQLFHDLFAEWAAQHIVTPGGKLRLDAILLRHFPALRPASRAVEWPKPLSPESERHRIRAAIRSFFLREAGRRPLLVQLEDLHWADPLSLELLGELLSLIARPARAKLLVLATFRDSESGGESSAWLARERGRLVSLHLKPLARREARLLAGVLAGKPVPQHQLNEWIAQSGGNPFFFTELARSSRSRPPRFGSALRGGIQSALDHTLLELPTPTLAPLRAAALIGADFPWSWWKAVTDRDERSLIMAHEAGLRASILQENRNGRIHFRHELMRQRLLQELPSAVKRRLHGRLFALLSADEALLRDNPQLLAHHAIAGRVVPASFRFGHRAVNRLIEDGQLQQAEKLLAGIEPLLTACRDPGAVPARLEQLRLRAWRDFQASNIAAAMNHCRRGIPLARRLHLPATTQFLLDIQGSALRFLGRFAEAQLDTREAIAIARRRGDVNFVPKAMANLAFGWLCQGPTAPARRVLRRALPLLRRRGASEAALFVHAELADVGQASGRFGEVLKELRIALRLAEDAGSPNDVAGMSSMRATALLMTGEPGQALRLFLKVKEMFNRIRGTDAIVTMQYEIGYTRALLGRLREGQAEMKAVIRDRIAARDTLREALARNWLAETWCIGGNTREGLKEIRMVNNVMRRHGYLWGEALSLVLAAQLRQQLGQHARAAAAARRAREIAGKCGYLEVKALLLGIEAVRGARLGEPGHRAKFNRAIRLARAGRNAVADLRITLEYSRALRASGNGRNARALARRAAARARRADYRLFERELLRTGG